MSKSEPWMPFYVGDYLRDTTRLTTEQHGAYLLLIADYWSSGAPPDDDAVLAQITRLAVKRWKQIRPVLQGFFTILDGVWTHKRIEAELERSRQFREKQQANGKLGGRPKKTHGESQKKPSGLPNGKPNESLSQSQLQEEVPLDKESNGASPDADALFWSSAKAFLKPRVEGDPGKLIGQWLRDQGKELTLGALSAAQVERAVDPIQYIQGYFRRHGRQSQQADTPIC